MLEVIGTALIEQGHPALAISVAVSREVPIPAAARQVYVGPFMRFTALDSPRRGGFLEVQRSDNVWITQATWEEL